LHLSEKWENVEFKKRTNRKQGQMWTLRVSMKRQRNANPHVETMEIETPAFCHDLHASFPTYGFSKVSSHLLKPLVKWYFLPQIIW
jgi:hypothetical protein